MRHWISARTGRIAGIAGLLSLWVIDMATEGYIPVLSNGFWRMDGEMGFHLAMWTGIVACCVMILQEEVD